MKTTDFLFVDKNNKCKRCFLFAINVTRFLDQDGFYSISRECFICRFDCNCIIKNEVLKNETI